MKLIDADALLEELDKIGVEMMDARMAHIATQIIVEQAPTIDPTYRECCGWCKHWKNDPLGMGYGNCKLDKHLAYVASNCDKFERKDNG